MISRGNGCIRRFPVPLFVGGSQRLVSLLVTLWQLSMSRMYQFNNRSLLRTPAHYRLDLICEDSIVCMAVLEMSLTSQSWLDLIVFLYFYPIWDAYTFRLGANLSLLV